MTAQQHDVVVIGGGPAGYGTALRCAEYGLKAVVVERGELGGTCLNVGCIPSKAVIHAADSFHRLSDPAELAPMGITAPTAQVDVAATMRWKDTIVERLRTGLTGTLQRSAIEVVRGHAEIIDAHTVRVHQPDGVFMITAASMVIATGSRPLELPDLPFGGPIVDSSGALALSALPDRLAVVGGGYIGVELGTAFRKLGAAVSIFEQAPSILGAFDPQLTRPVERRLDALGVPVHTDTTVLGYHDGCLHTRDTEGNHAEAPADVVLVAAGRRTVTEGFGLERLGVRLDNKGAIAVDAMCRTSVRDVYAVGDVTGEPMLAHRGVAQGHLVADLLAGDARPWDHRAVPFVCFTDPEVISVGSSLAETRAEAGDRPMVGQAPFTANGRALAVGAGDGTFVRVVADRSSGEVLGVHAVGPGVSELAAVASVVIEMGATLDDLAATIIAHPTLAEVVSDAVAAARRGA